MTWKPEELTLEALAARNQRIRNWAELILLIRKPYVFMGDMYFSLVENSFSMSIEENRAFVYGNAEAYGMTARVWAERDLKTWQERHPDWTFAIWAVNDPDLPVILNWDLWLDGHVPSNDTMAGVKNKHEARNIRFYPKGQQPPHWWQKTRVQSLVPMVQDWTPSKPVSLITGLTVGITMAQLHDKEQASRKVEP